MNDGVNGSTRNTTEIEMVGAKEAQSVHRLSDGTTLRIKPVMIAVFRAGGEQSAAREPAYSIKSTPTSDARAPAAATRPC